MLARKAEDANAFHYSLPAPAARLAAVPGTRLQITTSDGRDLPSWLRYVPESKSFVASDVPEGAFPLAVVINANGQKIQLTITEGPTHLLPTKVEP